MIAPVIDTVFQLASATPVPTPMPTVDPNDVTPGPAGFTAIFVVAVIAILLIVDMARRVRRVEYRGRVAAERSETGEGEQGQATAAGTPAEPDARGESPHADGGPSDGSRPRGQD